MKFAVALMKYDESFQDNIAVTMMDMGQAFQKLSSLVHVSFDLSHLIGIRATEQIQKIPLGYPRDSFNIGILVAFETFVNISPTQYQWVIWYTSKVTDKNVKAAFNLQLI